MELTPTRALVIGKLLPFHPGHSLVIDRALASGAVVDVIVCDRPGERPIAVERATWVRAAHPTASVHVVEDICRWHDQEPCPPQCSPAWADHLVETGLGPWTHVYGSERYVPAFAAALGAEAVIVDQLRAVVPISGSAIRADLAAHWEVLHPVVRAGLTRRVVVCGAESTGTTTLARDLAARLDGPWVPEHGRVVSEQRAQEAGSIWQVEWTSSDFDEIAEGQVRLESEVIDAWLGRSQRPKLVEDFWPLAVCDTDLLATAVWHRRYTGQEAPTLHVRAARRPPLLYVLTTPEGVPFEQDGLRDGEQFRPEMTGWFRDALDQQDAPWIEVSGAPEARANEVLRWLRLWAGPTVATAP